MPGSIMLEAAIEAARAAEEVIRRHYARNLQVDFKDDLTPVTVADVESEKTIRGILEQRFPDHGFYGEETGQHDLDAEYLWLVDPIDGTKSFVAGIPLYGTLIAHVVDGRPVVGAIDMPALRERWFGVAGRQTTLNDRLCQTSGCTELAKARVATTSIDMFAGEDRKRFDALSAAARQRQFGGDCYLYGILASGGVDLVVEAMLKPYDVAALVPVVEGAGGVMTDWRGNPLTVVSDGWVIAAATPELHAQAVAHLSG